MPSPSRTCRKHLREHCTEHCTAAEKPGGRIGLGRKIERFCGVRTFAKTCKEVYSHSSPYEVSVHFCRKCLTHSQVQGEKKWYNELPAIIMSALLVRVPLGSSLLTCRCPVSCVPAELTVSGFCPFLLLLPYCCRPPPRPSLKNKYRGQHDECPACGDGGKLPELGVGGSAKPVIKKLL